MKGFTLIELLTVIIIIAVIGLLVVPSVLVHVNKSKDVAYNSMIKSFEEAAVIFVSEHRDITELNNPGDSYDVSLKTLVNEGLLKKELINPKTNENVNLSTCVHVEYMTNNDITYEYTNQVCSDGEIAKSRDTMMEREEVSEDIYDADYYLRLPIYSNDIESIKTLDLNNVDITGKTTYDVSTYENRTVLAWYEDVDNNELYEVYIASNEKVKLSSGNRLFSLGNLVSLDLTYIDTSEVTTMEGMFSNTQNLKEVKSSEGINIINFDTSKVVNMERMFMNMGRFLEIAKSIDDNINKVINISSKSSFGVKFVSNTNDQINNFIIDFDTSNVTNMSEMFQFANISTLTLSDKFATNNVTDMNSMFEGDLTEIITPAGLNVINFETSKVTDMGGMFYGIELNTLTLSDKFVTNNVTNMSNMFQYMENLTNLDIRYFDFSKVTGYYNTFADTPTSVQITVNQAGSDWLTSNFPSYTNKIIVP